MLYLNSKILRWSYCEEKAQISFTMCPLVKLPENLNSEYVHATNKNYLRFDMLGGLKLPSISKLKFLESESNYAYQANTIDS